MNTHLTITTEPLMDPEGKKSYAYGTTFRGACTIDGTTINLSQQVLSELADVAPRIMVVKFLRMLADAVERDGTP